MELMCSFFYWGNKAHHQLDKRNIIKEALTPLFMNSCIGMKTFQSLQNLISDFPLQKWWQFHRFLSEQSLLKLLNLQREQQIAFRQPEIEKKIEHKTEKMCFTKPSHVFGTLLWYRG